MSNAKSMYAASHLQNGNRAESIIVVFKVIQKCKAWAMRCNILTQSSPVNSRHCEDSLSVVL
jgi:hypothetical protein